MIPLGVLRILNFWNCCIYSYWRIDPLEGRNWCCYNWSSKGKMTILIMVTASPMFTACWENDTFGSVLLCTKGAGLWESETIGMTQSWQPACCCCCVQGITELKERRDSYYCCCHCCYWCVSCRPVTLFSSVLTLFVATVTAANDDDDQFFDCEMTLFCQYSKGTHFQTLTKP